MFCFCLFFSLASFVVNITSISLRRSAAKKQELGIGGNVPELGLIFRLSRYELSEITWNRTDGKCQSPRKKSTTCDSFKFKYTCTRFDLYQSNWLIYLIEDLIFAELAHPLTLICVTRCYCQKTRVSLRWSLFYEVS